MARPGRNARTQAKARELGRRANNAAWRASMHPGRKRKRTHHTKQKMPGCAICRLRHPNGR